MSELLDRLQAPLEGRYRVERELAGGGLSQVFVAEEVDSSRAATEMRSVVSGLGLFELCNPILASARRQPIVQDLVRRIGLSDQKACRDSS